MTSTTEYYSSTSRDFLSRARVYLAQDDLLQASEKGWGAAAQMVKCIAETRGWPHDGHRLLYQAVNRLSAETGDTDIRTLFRLAGDLHINFYEGWLPREMVEDGLTQVAELMQKLESLA